MESISTFQDIGGSKKMSELFYDILSYITIPLLVLVSIYCLYNLLTIYLLLKPEKVTYGRRWNDMRL